MSYDAIAVAHEALELAGNTPEWMACDDAIHIGHHIGALTLAVLAVAEELRATRTQGVFVMELVGENDESEETGTD